MCIIYLRNGNILRGLGESLMFWYYSLSTIKQ